MFGTLVIQLPSNYKGGQLTIYHQSMKTDFNFSGPAGYDNFHYVAFYADCQHEIKPVTDGYRLCLVYNLIYQGSGDCPVPENNQEIVSSIVSSMKEWNEDDSVEQPPMMTYLLEHQYSEASLSFQLLKNVDRAVADILTEAKKSIDFDLYLAQVNVSEYWSAEFEYGCVYGVGAYEADELMDEEVVAKNLKSQEGQCISSIHLDRKYFVPKEFFNNRDPDREETEGYTGNEGATIDKHYKWAALLIWPSRKRIANLGISNMISLFGKDLLHYATHSPSQKAKLEEAAKDLMSSLAHVGHNRDNFILFLQSLQIIGKVELISEFLGIIGSSIPVHSSLIRSSSFHKEVVNIGSKYGWRILDSSLQAIFDNLPSSMYEIEAYCQFLHEISHHYSSETQKASCQCLARTIVKKLSNVDDAKSARIDFSKVKKIVSVLLRCLVYLKCNKQLPHFVQVLCSKPNCYPVIDVLAPVCEKLYDSLKKKKKGKETLDQLIAYCVSFLQESSRTPPSPTDWSEHVTFSCSQKECVELVGFLGHPTETVHKFKACADIRDHLESHLHNAKCSVTCSTERVGSPHTLVVKKNRAGYDRKIKACKKMNAIIVRLQALSGASELSEPLTKRRKVTEKQ